MSFSCVPRYLPPLHNARSLRRWRVLLGSILAFLYAAAGAAQLHSVDTVESPTGLVVVRLHAGASIDNAMALVRRYGATILDEIRIGPARFFVLRPDDTAATDQLLASIRLDRNFLYAERDYRIPRMIDPQSRRVDAAALTNFPGVDGASLQTNDPLLSNQWWLSNDGRRPGSHAGADINIESAWEVTQGSSSVVIAIGEEGFQTDHPDLAGAFVDDSAQMAGLQYSNRHGTEVIGVAAARGNNNIGVSGAAPVCRVVMAHTEYGASTAGMLRALAKVAEWNPVVFTNSWGLAQIRRQPLQEAYDIVARTGRNGKGILILFAAGNDGFPWVAYPGWFDRFMSIGGSTDADQRWEMSSFGRELDLVAPSTDILTTSVGSEYSYASGTSFATPMVAGVAALVASADSSLTADSIRAILELTADRIGGYGYEEERRHGAWSPYTGYGRVNAGRAVRMAKGLPPVDPDRLIWPLGGEEIHPDRTYRVRWMSRGPAAVVARSVTSGRIDTLASSTSGGYHAVPWQTAQSDLITIRLVDPATRETLDSTTARVVIRRPPFTITVDTTTPFIDIDDSVTRRETVWSGGVSANFATPFDLLIDGDTLWAWGMQSWGSDASKTTSTTLKRPGFPQLDPQLPGTAAALTLLSNDITGYDSARIALTGESPDRTVIVQSYGLHLDTLLYPDSARSALKGYRRQIRFHERDGTISYHYDRAVNTRQGDSALAERGGFTVALRTRNELMLPFDSLHVHRVPAGSITFTPVTGGSRQAPRRAVLLSRTSTSTYGYDVYRIALLANSPLEIGLSTSSDGGLTWERSATIPQGTQKGQIVMPTRYNGDLLVSFDEANDNGWRDTLHVVDHGYTIEPIATDTALSIADDRRSALLVFTDSTGEAELPLPFDFPYFGTSYPRVVVTRDGTIVPVEKSGTTSLYGFIGAYPRFAKANPDTVVPVRFLLTTEGGIQVAIIEWDSLALVAGATMRSASVQVRLRQDGVIDLHQFNAPEGSVPYYTAPAISSGSMLLRSPDFTLRADPQGPLALPLGSYRYTAHTPTTEISRRMPPSTILSRLLQMYPNPSASTITIEPGGEGRVVTVRDLMGRSVARFSGREAVTWRTDGVADGPYFIDEQPSGRHAVAVVRR